MEGVEPSLKETIGHTIAQVTLMISLLLPTSENIANSQGEMQTNRDNVNVTQGRTEGMAQRSGAQSRKRGILGSRAVGSIKTLGSDKTVFRGWNEKLVNVFI